MTEYRMFLISEALPGRADAYSAWCRDQHLPDIMRIPGVVGAERTQLQAADPAAPTRFLTVFRLSVEPAQVMAEMRRRNGTPDMPSGQDYDPKTLQFLFGEVIGDWAA